MKQILVNLVVFVVDVALKGVNQSFDVTLVVVGVVGDGLRGLQKVATHSYVTQFGEGFAYTAREFAGDQDVHARDFIASGG